MLRSPRSFPGNVQKNNRNTGWVSTLNRGEGVDPFIYSIIVSVSKQFPSCVAARKGPLPARSREEAKNTENVKNATKNTGTPKGMTKNTKNNKE